MLDKLYRARMQKWQRLIDSYDLKFDKRMRDLEPDSIVRISRFYPVVRQIIASVAFNYPKLFFVIEDEDAEDVADILERAAASLMNLMQLKPHVHQAIFDALFCSVGWLRIDYNPPGDEMIAPYVANDAMEEDLTAVSRVSPGHVHLDPTCPPHMLGYARYIRERMWVPIRFLKEDTDIQHRREIKPTTVNGTDELGFGEPQVQAADTDEQQAIRSSIENGEYVLVDRIHDRINKKLLMFVDGVDKPVMDRPHPFMKMEFPQRMDLLGGLLFEDDGQTPILDLQRGEPGVGWLVEQGFPFVPVKFDMHSSSFYPEPPLAYIEDIQNGIVEGVSRRSDLLKRTARQGVVAEEEALNNPHLLDNLRKGVDGQWHTVLNPANFHELNYGNVPGDLYANEDRLIAYEEQTIKTSELTQGGGPSKTATEVSMMASDASINREWMVSRVADTYISVVRNCFQVLGDPRYTPEALKVNVAPDGEQRMTRILTSADFLWNYRIQVVAGSTQPMAKQLEQERWLGFYDRAAQRPNFDQLELDKRLAAQFDIMDSEKLLVDQYNVEAQRAAQMENAQMLQQLTDPGVLPEQDHAAHAEVHQQYQGDPQYQQLMQRAQATLPNGQAFDPQAGQMVQMIDQIVQGHLQEHMMAEQEQTEGGVMPRAAGSPATVGDSIQSQVQSNAQKISDVATAEAQAATEGV